LKIASDFRAALQPNWSQLEAGAAIRCAIGVAIPLVVGAVLQQNEPNPTEIAPLPRRVRGRRMRA